MKNMNITTTETSVTPELADKWLQKHYDSVAKGDFVQRPISQQIVTRYANDMRLGKWLLCPQPAVFDEKDNLIDGQHRLAAVKLSGKTITMLISRGWPVSQNGLSTIDVVDRGRPRSIYAQLSLHGIPRATVMAASVTHIARMLADGRNLPLTYPQVRYVLDSLDMMKHILKIAEQSGSGGGKGRLYGPLAYYRTVRPQKADEFANRLFTMDFEKGSAVQTFAKYNRDRTVSPDVYVRALCTALRAWDANETIAFLRGPVDACRWLLKQNPKLHAALETALTIAKP